MTATVPSGIVRKNPMSQIRSDTVPVPSLTAAEPYRSVRHLDVSELTPTPTRRCQNGHGHGHGGAMACVRVERGGGAGVLRVACCSAVRRTAAPCPRASYFPFTLRFYLLPFTTLLSTRSALPSCLVLSCSPRTYIHGPRRLGV